MCLGPGRKFGLETGPAAGFTSRGEAISRIGEREETNSDSFPLPYPKEAISQMSMFVRLGIGGPRSRARRRSLPSLL